MKKILIVADDENILTVVRHILTSVGFNVKTDSTGLNVPDIVMHYHPNIILLEKTLAGKLDRIVCLELSQINIHLPIILFSAEIDEEKSFDLCDGDEFMQKPFEIKNLPDTINLQLN